MNEEIGGKKREANSVFMREDLDEMEGGGGDLLKHGRLPLLM